MEHTFGEFLKGKRIEKRLTQKELAKMLIVSESAVSKWEKDVAHPDITLLPKLAEILGVTEHELITASIDKQSREEKVQAKKWRVFSFSWSLFFYIAYAVALIPCFICDLAINKTLTWFWIVLSALLLAFTFTNLPKLIKKHKLLIVPASMFGALVLLLGVCAIYSGGNWFWIPTFSVLLGLSIIFVPIYISKYDCFSKIRKFGDFVSVGIDFIALNILFVIIDVFTVANGYTSSHWYLTLALPISFVVYMALNILLSVRFLKVNKFFKTSIILLLIDIMLYVPPVFLNFKNPAVQREVEQVNIFKANFTSWISEETINNNINCIIALTLLTLSSIFAIVGIIRRCGRKANKKEKTLY